MLQYQLKCYNDINLLIYIFITLHIYVYLYTYIIHFYNIFLLLGKYLMIIYKEKQTQTVGLSNLLQILFVGERSQTQLSSCSSSKMH